MQIFTELVSKDKLSLALGYFDGVHYGHKKVIESAVNFAKNNGNKSAVITFSDHPCCYFKGVTPKYILTREERRKQIEKLGIDFLYELDFKKILNLTAQEYLKEVLVKYFSPVSISTGWNHNFGYRKSGDVKFLEEMSKIYNYKYFELPAQKLNNEIISSTNIRQLLSNGNIEKVNKMLNRNFSINGIVIKGKQIGRTIGFPTANILYPEELVELPHGVYSVNTNFGKGIANFGKRPTVNGENILLEVHILNFDKFIYGENINVEFNKMIRAEQKFSSLDALKNQINIDIKNI